MNKFRINLRLVFLALLIFLISNSAHAILVNPGFETGDFSGWTVTLPNGGGGSGVAVDAAPLAGEDSIFEPAFQNVRSGDYGAYGIVASTPLEYLSLSQVVTISGAGTYLTGFFMGNDSGNQFGIDNAIDDGILAIFVDSVNVGFDTRYPINNFPTGSTSADMYEFSTNVFYSAGTHTIEFRISGSGTARAGISVDDFFLDASATVPEPTTLALMGLGLAGIGYRRQRSKKVA